jgi:hypothetical protein
MPIDIMFESASTRMSDAMSRSSGFTEKESLVSGFDEY